MIFLFLSLRLRFFHLPSYLNYIYRLRKIQLVCASVFNVVHNFDSSLVEAFILLTRFISFIFVKSCLKVSAIVNDRLSRKNRERDTQAHKDRKT